VISRATAIIAIAMAMAPQPAGAQPAGAQPAGAQPASIGGNFSLIAAPDRTVSNTDFHGKYLLVFFGYTACPDLCPATLDKIARALRLMGSHSSQIQPIFITIDPAHDTPAIMASYAALFSPDIIGLSGAAAQIAAVEQEYHVYAGPRDPKTGAIAHSAILYLMRPDGRFATAIPDNITAPALADSLLKLTSAA
jgi:protein SCO1/2